jgi:hypothetical protein
MTACAYLSPNNFPNLLADTLVSGATDANVSLTPANWISLVSSEVGPNPPILSRKIYFFGKRTAIALSGGLKSIRTLLNKANALMQDFEREERPIRELGDQANEINEGLRQNEKVYFVGATVIQKNGGTLINKVTEPFPESKQWHRLAGDCAFIGSGRDELARIVKTHDDTYPVETRILPQHTREYMRRLVGDANGEKIRADKNNDGRKNEHWGGFLEHAYFDFKKGIWRMTPSWLSAVFFFHISKAGTVTVALHQWIAYDSGEVHGKLLVATYVKQVVRFFPWSIENLLAPQELRPQSDQLTGWNIWRPNSITFTFVPMYKPGRRWRRDSIRFAVQLHPQSLGCEVPSVFH